MALANQKKQAPDKLTTNDEEKSFKLDDAPTLKSFLEHPGQIRCVVGPVGSGKTSAATWEVCYYLPEFLFQTHGIKKTRWVIVRNTYIELQDTTQQTIFEWFPWGRELKQQRKYRLSYPDGYQVELLFRSCDNPDDVKKFKSLEVTGYWIDESIEVAEEIKLMLRNRIGRYPAKSPVRFGIETTNPPSTDHPTYKNFKWICPPPEGAPVPEGIPLKNHFGFWQPAGENSKYLRPGYYEDLAEDYKNNPDWLDMYIKAMPGIIVKGELIYQKFIKKHHVALGRLEWNGVGSIIRGWDNTGNHPACVVFYFPTPGRCHVIDEYWAERMNIVEFAKHVFIDCNTKWPGATFVDYADPAGSAQFSTRDGDLTSNQELMEEGTGIEIFPAEQAFDARVSAVEAQLMMIDGLLISMHCHLLINGFLGGYCRPEIGKTGVYRETPTKNKYADIHDAFQYGMTGAKGAVKVGKKRVEPVRQAQTEYDLITHKPTDAGGIDADYRREAQRRGLPVPRRNAGQAKYDHRIDRLLRQRG